MAEGALDVLLRQILNHQEDGTYTTKGYATAKGTVTFKSEQDAQLFDVMYVVREISPRSLLKNAVSAPPGLSAT